MKNAEQAALIGWIWAQPELGPPAGLRATAAGLSAYREHAKALAVRALAAAYPRLQAWLGEADFAGLAWAFARAQPPQQGDMNRWGGALADFLRALPGMEAEPPLLADFDWHLHGIASAADDPEQEGSLWQRLSDTDPLQLRLRFSPMLRLFALPAGLDGVLETGAETRGGGPHWLAWRAGWRPAWAPLEAETAALLDALLHEPSLAAALQREAAAAPRLGPLLHQGWQQGWLLGLL